MELQQIQGESDARPTVLIADRLMTRGDGKMQDRNGEFARPTVKTTDGLTREEGKTHDRNGELAKPTVFPTDGLTRDDGKTQDRNGECARSIAFPTG